MLGNFRFSHFLRYGWTLRRFVTSSGTTAGGDIIRGPYEQIKIPERNVYRHVYEQFERYGDSLAIVDALDQKANVTFSELNERTCLFSSALRRLGFNKSDVVLIYSPNSVHYPTVFFGTLAVGGIVSTCNPAYTERELRHQLNDSQCKYIAVPPPQLETALKAIEGTQVTHVIVMDDNTDNFSNDRRMVALGEMISDSGSLFEEADVNPKEDLAVLPYSSGTTGLPKGVMLTHYNIVANMCQLEHPQIQLYSEDETLLGLLPYFHIYGMGVVLFSALRQGKRQVVLPKFEPHLFLHSLQEHRVTWAHLVPPLVLFLSKSPDMSRYDLSSLRMIITGAAPLGGDVLDTVRTRVGIDMVRQAYGLTETSPVTTYTTMSCGNSDPKSVGPPVLNQLIKIVDVNTGETLGPNREGELVISGPNIMLGYLNNPQATAECLTSDGWFHTGDVGYYNNQGNFTITDRLKELIKVKGFQVAPAELEDLLVMHPRIVDAAVIGVPHERFGEAPKAFVVKGDPSLDEREVMKHVEEKAAEHKWLLGGVEFVKEIPKSPSGKILRRTLK
jgi:acyl-CoA synthetase (AMP-forming)/AMP-acid ligase II